MAGKLANSQGLLVERIEGEPEFFVPAKKTLERGRLVRRARFAWEHRRRLVQVAGIGFVLSTVVAFVIPKTYESTTSLMPPDPSGTGMMMMAALAGRAGSNFAGLAGDMLGLRSSGVLFIGILKSRTVQDDLINKFDLRRVYSRKRWEDTREELAKLTEIAEDRKSGIISITVTDRSPTRAAAMAQEYEDELNRVITELNTSSAHRERVFLEQRLGQVKQDLETAEKDFSSFASKNTAIDIKEQGRAMIDSAAALEGQLIAAQTELESLRQIYTDNNVRVRAMQARVDELQRQLRKIGGSGTTGDSSSADAASYPSIRQLPLLGVSYADLYRRTKVQEAVFETLTQQYELAKVEEVKETPSVKVLDPPEIPEKKSSPHRLWIMFGGIGLSLCLALVWALGKARFAQLEADDPGKVFALEVYRAVQGYLPNGSSNGSPTGRNDATKTDPQKNCGEGPCE
jgi:uncharacterized protein involved in exopolysaccharide biosynthesis